MNRLIVFDLDGPLLDGKNRHYACYSGILRKAGYAPIPLDYYWQAKRALVPASKVLARSGALEYYPTFKQLWLGQIESEEMLALDELQSGAAELLGRISSAGHRTVIATLRQHPDRAHREIKRLGILDLIEEILVTPHSMAGDGKANAVLEYARPRGLGPVIWVGDTEVDAAAAASIGVPCALVTNGVRSAEALRGLPCIGTFGGVNEIPQGYFIDT